MICNASGGIWTSKGIDSGRTAASELRMRLRLRLRLKLRAEAEGNSVGVR